MPEPAPHQKEMESLVDTLPSPATPTTKGVSINIQATLVRLVSERTGYPEELLDLDLDLEADLSVDSIKRIEILGALGEELGLSEGSDEDRDGLIEELAMMKSLREVLIPKNEGPR